TPTPTPITPTPGVATPKPTIAPTPAPKISCLMCHTDSEKLAAHQHGGYKCIKCHGGPDATVHTVHPKSVKCEDCHIKNGELVKPMPVGEYSVCENCHGYPDASEPSEGNFVNIHIPRGKDCTVCHSGEISEIHKGTAKALPEN
ncbi:MAG: hypothetical protein ACXQS7_01295, partial [Candidatus Syntropharchaeia archaeon]